MEQKDLEKTVSDCHIVAREADVVRETGDKPTLEQKINLLELAILL